MKVLSQQISKNTRVKGFRSPFQAYILLSLPLVSLFILLTACDGRNTASAPTATAATVSKPATTLAATKAPVTTAAPTNPTTAASSQNGLVPNTGDLTDTPVALGRPVITFTPELARIGETVEITGTGYPTSTRLNIQIATADFKTLRTYDTVLTDEFGSFTTKLKLEGEGQGSYLTPGKLEIAITTADGRVGASAPLALQAAANASSDDACINLVREFFATMKRDAVSAQIYLSSSLRKQLTPDKKSISALLGIEVLPFRVDIVKVEGTKNSYKTNMYFADGTQKVIVLDVTNDTSGALKISKVALNK